MNYKKLILILIIVLIPVGIIAFQSTSLNFTLRFKPDFGGAGTNASSTSYTQRFIFGNQPVSQYTSDSYSGRFGIFEETGLVTSINFTYPLESSAIARGTGEITWDDDLGLIDDSLVLIAQVYNNSNSGVANANCSFYNNLSFIGSSLTNSSGHCNFSFDKTSEALGFRNFSVNYTVASGIQEINESFINVTLIRYNLPNYVSNTTSVGGLSKFIDGDVAKFYLNVTRINESGTYFYDPVNLTVNATNSVDTPYPESSYVSGYRLNKTGTGQYETWVVVDKSFGTAYVRWKVYASDDNFTSHIATALHTDVEIVTLPATNVCGDGTVGGSEECDDGNVVSGDGCSASCTTEGEGGGGGGGGCSNQCSPSGSVQSICSGDETISTRTCGNYDVDSCLEWSGWSETECAEGESCVESQCGIVCNEDWSCTEWSECINGVRERECEDLNECGTTDNKPHESESCLTDEYCIDGVCCGTNWACAEWGECYADYSFEDVISGKQITSGTQTRGCVDLEGCARTDILEKQECSLGIPITARTVEWCEEDYVEIVEKKTEKIVSRVKEREVFGFIELNRLDISFITTEFTGYCDYCYDGVKDYDETGIDCGGPNCPGCFDKYSYLDWLFWLILILWILLFIVLFILWKNREKKIGKKKFSLKRFVKNIFLTKEKEKVVEGRIGNFFKNFFKKKVERQERIYIEPEREVAPPRRIFLNDLKKKLAKWKRIGYSGTAKLGAKIKKLEQREKLFVSRIFTGYLRRREESIREKSKEEIHRELEERREEHYRILEKERLGRVKRLEQEKEERRPKKSWFKVLFGKSKPAVEKPKKKSIFKRLFVRKEKFVHSFPKESFVKRLVVSHKKRKEAKKHKKHLVKIRKKFEKEIKRENKQEKKKIKVMARIKKKIKKNKLSGLKKEIRKRKIFSLMQKLKLWRSQGYYGTAKLETELKRLRNER